MESTFPTFNSRQDYDYVNSELLILFLLILNYSDNSEEGQESEGRIKNHGELLPESRMSPNQGTNNICLDGFQNHQGPKQLCISYFPSLWVKMSMTLFNACPKLYVECEGRRYLASFVPGLLNGMQMAIPEAIMG